MDQKLLKRIIKLRIENEQSLQAILNSPLSEDFSQKELTSIYNEVQSELKAEPQKKQSNRWKADKIKPVKPKSEPYFKKMSFWIKKNDYQKFIEVADENNRSESARQIFKKGLWN